MPGWLDHLLRLLALPEVGLSTLFVVSFVSATLVPVASEPALFGLIKLNPELFWPAMAVATVGNTLGGMVDWWMGWAASRVAEHYGGSRAHLRALGLLERLGPPACMLGWVPVIGDPLCTMAGWLRLPLWPCTFYMLVGKFVRYLALTAGLLAMFPSPWSPGHGA